ncbi:MAG: glycosyltransferase [Janthinobacterium lividum]
MKLLLIITDYGSFNNFLSEVAVTMVNAGHEVHVICSPVKVINYENKYPYEQIGIKFHYSNFPRSFNIFKQITASKKIHTIISQINPDLIHAHFTTGIFTTLIWRKPTQFIIGTIHGIGYPTIKRILKRKIFEMVEKFCFTKLDQIYLINQLDYELVKATYPQKTFKYNSFGVGCDLKRFDPSALSHDFKLNFRKSLSITKNDFVLVYTGRFVAFKGFNTVIKAMIALINEAEYPNIRLILIGGDDPAHRTGLSYEEVSFYKNSNKIIYVGFTKDVNLYLAISDLFVFPSIKEGMPVCIMEALAMGIPVITSDTRGCNDLIENNFNGLLLSEEPSVSETKDAILKLYHDHSKLKKFSVNALLKRGQYSRDHHVENQIEIYKVVALFVKESNYA